MSLKSFVKVGSVTNLSDARYCAGMNVDLLGFTFTAHAPDYVEPEKFKDIAGWLSGISFVGEFHGSDVSYIKQIAEQCKLNIVQVDLPELIKPLKNSGFTVMLECNLSMASTLTSFPDYLILNADQAPEEDEYDHVRNLNDKTPILLSTQLDKSNVETLLKKTGAHGIALKGSEEIRPGYKDYDQLADILELLEEE